MTTEQAPGSTSVSIGSTSGETPAWSGGVETGVRAWVGDHPEPPPPPPDTEAEGPDADPESVARTILLDQLTGRARSRQELSDKLAAKLVPPEIAGRLLDRFEEVGLVDDAAFARTWVSQRQSAGGGGKGLARRALAQELRRKGVDDETTREVLDELDPADEEAAARELVRRKLRTLSRIDDQTATRRLVGMLARKGYSSGLAFSVVRDELAAAGREEPDEPHSI
ncbi:MAG TPA: regulatory protein RecX [Nocardioides sp.]|nr:regulatory protein RecX [Nocardioides sp.]